MPRLNVGLIGLGAQSLSEHLPALLDSDRVELVAVCDTDKLAIERMRAVASARGAPLRADIYDRVNDFFEHDGLAFVVAAVPHSVYPDIVHRCSDKGVSLLKEKPFARNIAEGQEFSRIAADSGIKIMTAFQRRFHPLYESFKYLMRSLGRIHLIQGTYTISSKSPNSGWRGIRSDCGGGVLLDMGYHIFDELIWFLEARPEWVQMSAFNCGYGKYDVEDSCFVNFKTGGAVGNIFISCVSPIKREELVFIGERGSATLTRDGISRRNTAQLVLDELSSPASWHTANIKQLDYFVDVLQGLRDEYYSTPSFQLSHNVPTLDACYLSMREDRRVRIDELIHLPKSA